MKTAQEFYDQVMTAQQEQADETIERAYAMTTTANLKALDQAIAAIRTLSPFGAAIKCAKIMVSVRGVRDNIGRIVS